MRQRMLSPDFWGDAGIIEAFPYPEEYPGRTLYQFLWNYAEDSGVFTPNCADIKMRFAPGDGFTKRAIERWYTKLVEIGKVIEFDQNGGRYGWLRNFHRWQRIDNPTPPRLPLPPWVEFRNLNEPGENKRSRYRYVVLADEWDLHQVPPRKRGQI